MERKDGIVKLLKHVDALQISYSVLSDASMLTWLDGPGIQVDLT